MPNNTSKPKTKLPKYTQKFGDPNNVSAIDLNVKFGFDRMKFTNGMTTEMPKIVMIAK